VLNFLKIVTYNCLNNLFEMIFTDRKYECDDQVDKFVNVADLNGYNFILAKIKNKTMIDSRQGRKDGRCKKK
jgi:hypothetical protein